MRGFYWKGSPIALLPFVILFSPILLVAAAVQSIAAKVKGAK